MTTGENETVSYSVKEVLESVRTEQTAGFRGVHSRLDKLNGRVRTAELDISNIRGRSIVAGAVAGLVASAALALVAALILRGLVQ